ITPYDAGILVAEQDRADYFEAVAEGRDAKLAANWMISELFGRLNKASLEIADSPVSAAALGELVDMIADDTISGRIAKEVFDEMVETGQGAGAIVEAKGLKQITDTGALETVVDEIIAGNPEQAEQFREGKQSVVGWFVGQAMKATQGKANPKAVNEILRKKLG
ncbi:MAG: Asp-tRNA(Asn)/Glu-tRNA(Gln) amidotransferase GatCAB subunit B, partial [Rhodospirillaceae bacterium]|nr:Asp-tRNA(Asn)/Glu-tRNA(Gln) amidotransferase GatCAB subunit B [Rhodospirillaceae bacterium]